MNKKLRVLLAIVLSLVLVFALVACTGPAGEQGEPGEPGESVAGPAGSNGKSAYELAVAGGYTGSEADWLASLKGADGKTARADNSLGAGEFYDSNEEFDYYAAKYEGVGYNNVFKTIVYPDLREVLLAGYGAPSSTNLTAGTSGKFAILLGGAWDSYTSAMMATVNAQAKAKGINTVWVMDTYYDGKIGETLSPMGTISQARINAISSQTEIGLSTVNANYSLTQLIGLFNNAKGENAAEVLRSGAAGTAANSALLMVIDVPAATAARTDGATGTKPSIVKHYTNTDFESYDSLAFYPVKAATFASKIGDVLGEIGATQEGYFDAYTLRSGRTHLGEIATPNDFATFRNVYLQSINYAELLTLLSTPGDHVVFFGAFACPNFQALVRPMYEQAVATGFTGKIYHFDMTTIGTNASTMGVNMRGGTNATLYLGRLYAHIFDNFLSGYESFRNGGADGANHQNAVWDASTNARAVSIGGIAYTRICLPAVMLYNNQVESDLASATAVSKGGIVDVHESEMSYANATTAGHVQKLFADRSFKLMFEKYGVAQQLIEMDYSVKSLRNYASANIRISTNDVLGIYSGTKVAPSEGLGPFTASSGTMSSSGWGLDVMLVASNVALGDKVTVLYNYFATSAEIDAITAATGTAGTIIAGAARVAAIKQYKTDGAYATAVKAAITTSKQKNNAIYYGSANAVLDIENILGVTVTP